MNITASATPKIPPTAVLNLISKNPPLLNSPVLFEQYPPRKSRNMKIQNWYKTFCQFLPSLLLLCWIIDILVYLANKHGWNTLIKKVKYENVGYIRLEKAATCKFKTNIQLFANSFHSSSRCWLINILVYLPNLTKRNFVRTKKSQQVNQTKK